MGIAEKDEVASGSFSVYILESTTTGRYYVGSTGDLGSRVLSHNAGLSHWSARGRPRKVVYKETWPTRAEAVRRERAIKARKSRKFIERLIAGFR